MRITSDHSIQVSATETLRLQSTTASLNFLEKQAGAGQELEIKLPLARGAHQLQANSIGAGNLTITSSSGQQWTTALLPGSNFINFLVEPEPDVWYCENDDGTPPPHPVFKRRYGLSVLRRKGDLRVYLIMFSALLSTLQTSLGQVFSKAFAVCSVLPIMLFLGASLFLGANLGGALETGL